jgi:hypothetical protein
MHAIADSRFGRRFGREVFALGLPLRQEPRTHLEEAEVSKLPAVVGRYLRFMGVVGRPRDWSFRVGFHGDFRMSPTGAWLPCSGWQYNTSLDVSRIFHMRLAMGRVIPTTVRDTYLLGRGRMQAKVLDLVPVVDARGRELDIGELVTYLVEALMFAPTMVIGPMSTFVAVDDGSFDVTLRDRANSVTARVFVDDRGAPTDVSTIDRFVNDPYAKGHPFVRARWSTPIDSWSATTRPHPVRARAIWHLDRGNFEYARFEFEDLARDVAPGQ